MSIAPLLGRPGVGAVTTATHDFVFRDGVFGYYPAGGVIDGTKARDPDNAADTTLLLRVGLPMGKITSSGKYANSILGVTQGAYTSGATSITVTAAQAAEIVRRIGTSGTLKFVGPPTAGGTNAVISQSFSAVNTSTGVLTITSLGANLIAGAFVCPTDGSETPTTLIPDGFGVMIGSDSADVSFPRLPVSGLVQVDRVINWPTDTTLKTYLRTSLSTVSGGKFVFSDQF